MRGKQRPKFVARIEPDPADEPVLPAKVPDADRLAGGGKRPGFRASEGNMAGPVKTLEVVPSGSEPPVIDGSAVDVEDRGKHFSDGLAQAAQRPAGFPCTKPMNAEPRSHRQNHCERPNAFKPKKFITCQRWSSPRPKRHVPRD